MVNSENMEEHEIWGKKPLMTEIHLQDATNILRRGLCYFLGENYKWLPEYEEIATWLYDNKGRGLLFYGSNGRGKTILCSNIIPMVFQYYLHIEYYQYDAIELGSEFRNAYGNINLMIRNNPLFIDDIGTESIINDYGEKHDIVSEVIYKAEKQNRLLVLTTNLTPDELSERYGVRTLDRLKAIVKSVKSIGNSLRGTNND